MTALPPDAAGSLVTVLERCSYIEQLLGLCGRAGLQTDDWVRRNRKSRDSASLMYSSYVGSLPPANPAPFQHPLTDEHYQLLNAILQGCSTVDEGIAQAQAAGVNVTKLAADNERRKQLASGLKASFFPDRS